MKILNSKLRLGVALGVLAVAAPITASAGTAAPGGVTATHGMSPAVALGPQATPANATANGANYGLFSCQVGLDPDGVVCYDPYQMRTAYGVNKLLNQGYTGHGSTIVIVDAFQSPNIVDQLNVYDGFYGLPSLNGLGSPSNPSLGTFTQIAPDGLTPFVPGDPNMTGWAEEISLDVLWAHAIAPGANVTLVLAKSNNDTDIFSATKYAVDHNLGNVISQSFGENESCVDPSLLAQQHQVFADATAKHITLFASSGDQGAAQQTCDGNSWTQAASSPAVDPLVTAVGGTELHAADYCLTVLGCNPAANPAPGTYSDEIAWNEGPPFGDFQLFFDSTLSTGGGYSVIYGEPPYQKSTIHDGKQRAVPDVAYSAAVLHGALTYLDIPGIPAGMYLFGGTSVGSPQWSAITAIADQKAGQPLGFINKALYDLGKRPNYNGLFHDVTSGTNSAIEFDAHGNPVSVTGFNAGTGWDATTGLGSPRADTLVDGLIKGVSPGDSQSAISTTKSSGQGKGHIGKVSPH